MARKPRIEFEGALYHVITRGNQKQRIFRGTEDYERYLKILGDYKTRYEFTLPFKSRIRNIDGRNSETRGGVWISCD